MQNVSYSGGKNNTKTQSKRDHFSQLFNLTQSMTNGLSSSIENQVYQSIDEVGRIKKISNDELDSIKNAVKVRAEKSQILLNSRVEKSLKQASTQLSKALSKEVNKLEKTLSRIEKKINKIEKSSWV